MTVSADMVATWRRPRQILRQHLARGQSEPFAFSLLLVFLALTFIGQWPVAAREAFLAEEASPVPRILARAFAVLATIPLWYLLAALSRLVARALGGQGNWYGARIALFWALAAVGPLMLLQGMVGGMIGPGSALSAVTLAVGLAFLWLWATLLHEAERG
ncbi:YIP1 family protein [Tabrizicola sp.]|uniref:YIP1 family protein n=1 Tax=Tabrizicola sp. TaxID=2005166 RepID=UPI002734FEE6|nr:YIP1 family protein [Tabrizicola sp.]MDP3196362.1 YIP1 family protein [Tabrizicola sp.]